MSCALVALVHKSGIRQGIGITNKCTASNMTQQRARDNEPNMDYTCMSPTASHAPFGFDDDESSADAEGWLCDASSDASLDNGYQPSSPPPLLEPDHHLLMSSSEHHTRVLRPLRAQPSAAPSQRSSSLPTAASHLRTHPFLRVDGVVGYLSAIMPPVLVPPEARAVPLSAVISTLCTSYGFDEIVSVLFGTNDPLAAVMFLWFPHKQLLLTDANGKLMRYGPVLHASLRTRLCALRCHLPIMPTGQPPQMLLLPCTPTCPWLLWRTWDVSESLISDRMLPPPQTGARAVGNDNNSLSQCTDGGDDDDHVRDCMRQLGILETNQDTLSTAIGPFVGGRARTLVGAQATGRRPIATAFVSRPHLTGKKRRNAIFNAVRSRS